MNENFTAVKSEVDDNDTRIAALETAVSDLQTRLTAAENTIITLQTELAAVQSNSVLALGPYVSVDTNTINGVVGPHVILSGVNLHVRSGFGSTNDITTGLGNP